MTNEVLAQGQRGQAPAAQVQTQGRGTPYVGKPMPPNTPGRTYTVIQNADLGNVMKQTTGDTPVRVVGAPDSNYGVYVITYQPRAAQPGERINGIYHTDIGEIYYVINGTGTALLGGELENATENDPEGNATRNISGHSAGGVMKNATLVRYQPGTIFVVPPGVPHQGNFDIISRTDYLVIRVDPKKQLNLK
jgi:uncharacterized RmlC-like cupin family protein